MYSLEKGLRARHVVSHPESRTKTCEEMFAGCVSLTHCSLTSSFLQPRWFLPNVIKLFSRPPKPVLFTPVRGRSGGYSSQIWHGMCTRICRLKPLQYTCICKIQFISYISTDTHTHPHNSHTYCGSVPRSWCNNQERKKIKALPLSVFLAFVV